MDAVMIQHPLRLSLPATLALSVLLAACASQKGDKAAAPACGSAPAATKADASTAPVPTSAQPEMELTARVEADTMSGAVPPPTGKPVGVGVPPEAGEQRKAEEGKPAERKPEPAKAELPPLVVHPEAELIAERARETLKAIRTISCETMLEGSGASAAGIEILGVWHRVQMRFQTQDGVSIPKFRITRIDRSAAGDVAGPTIVYSGSRALEFDERTQTYVDLGNNWFRAVGAALPALPQWILEERFKNAQRARTPAGAPPNPLDPVMIGARILRTEELDGQTCDVVEFFMERNLVSMTEEGAAGGVVGKGLYIETIHYARSDSLPRRIVRQEIETPDTPGVGGDRITMNYAKFVLNPGYADEFFSANPPAGFKPQGEPKR
jgi:hypothetical protein